MTRQTKNENSKTNSLKHQNKFSLEESLCSGRAIYACRDINTVDDLKFLLRTYVRRAFPHQSAVCGVVELESRRILQLVNIDCPDAYLQQTIRTDRTMHCKLLDAWLCERKPKLIDIDETHAFTANSSLQFSGQHKLDNIAIHGVVESNGTTVTFFLFTNLSLACKEVYASGLWELIPHLHIAFTRAMTEAHLGESWINGYPLRLDREESFRMNGVIGKSFALTPRENEVLEWIKKGKTNWEISQILKLSVHTVKNHVCSILKKRGVVNRTQAACHEPPIRNGANV